MSNSKSFSILFRGVLVVFLLIIVIYNFQLRALPIAPRTIMTLLGGVIFVFNVSSKAINTLYFKKYMSILFLFVLLVSWGFMCMVANGSAEWLYPRAMKEWVALFFASYLIAVVAKPLISDVKSVYWLVSIAIALESTIAIVGYFNPSFHAFIQSIEYNEILETVDRDFYFYRMIGLGNAYFFGVLPSCLLGLMSCAYLIAKSKATIYKILALVSFFVITVASVMTARTSAAMIVISLLAMMLFSGKRKMFVTVLIVAVIFYFILNVGVSFLPDEMADWIFEFSDSGSSGTTDQIKGWYADTHFTSKTLFIGDAHYEGTGGSYYMHVDIGYFRQIFYAGLFGLFLKLLINYKCMKLMSIITKNDDIKKYGMLFFLGYLVLMAKGDLDMFVPIVLLVVMFNFCNIGSPLDNEKNSIRYKQLKHRGYSEVVG